MTTGAPIAEPAFSISSEDAALRSAGRDLANLEAAGNPNRPIRLQQAGTIATLYLGYAMFMVLRMIPTVVGTAICDDPSLGIDLDAWGRIIALGTWGAVAGKFVCGYAADRFGGKPTFTIGLLVASLFVGAFGFATEVWMFQAAFFITLMAKSAGWPSMARIIINWIPRRNYGRAWGILSTSSRIGTLVATFCLGSLLAWMSWRSLLWLSAGLGLIAVVAFAFLLKERPKDPVPGSSSENSPAGSAAQGAPHPFEGTSLAEALPRVFRSPRFWLIACSLMGLGILWDFLLLVPLFLKARLGLSSADAARAASAFPLGSLFSVLVGGFVFDRLNRRTTAWVMGLLLTFATGCLAAFCAMPQFAWSPAVALGTSLALLFAFGLCVSPCYYIPMSVFSIEFGGPHSGVLIALLDATSFTATAVFYYYGGGWAQQSWTLFLSVLCGVSVWSTVTTFLFLRGEARWRRS